MKKEYVPSEIDIANTIIAEKVFKITPAKVLWTYSKEEAEKAGWFGEVSAWDGIERNYHIAVHEIPSYLTDIKADYTVLDKVRKTWSKEDTFLLVGALETVQASHQHEYKFLGYEVGDYSRAVLEVLKNK